MATIPPIVYPATIPHSKEIQNKLLKGRSGRGCLAVRLRGCVARQMGLEGTQTRGPT